MPAFNESNLRDLVPKSDAVFFSYLLHSVSCPEVLVLRSSDDFHNRLTVPLLETQELPSVSVLVFVLESSRDILVLFLGDYLRFTPAELPLYYYSLSPDTAAAIKFVDRLQDSNYISETRALELYSVPLLEFRGGTRLAQTHLGMQSALTVQVLRRICANASAGVRRPITEAAYFNDLSDYSFALLAETSLQLGEYEDMMMHDTAPPVQPILFNRMDFQSLSFEEQEFETMKYMFQRFVDSSSLSIRGSTPSSLSSLVEDRPITVIYDPENKSWCVLFQFHNQWLLYGSAESKSLADSLQLSDVHLSDVVSLQKSGEFCMYVLKEFSISGKPPTQQQVRLWYTEFQRFQPNLFEQLLADFQKLQSLRLYGYAPEASSKFVTTVGLISDQSLRKFQSEVWRIPSRPEPSTAPTQPIPVREEISQFRQRDGVHLDTLLQADQGEVAFSVKLSDLFFAKPEKLAIYHPESKLEMTVGDVLQAVSKYKSLLLSFPISFKIDHDRELEMTGVPASLLRAEKSKVDRVHDIKLLLEPGDEEEAQKRSSVLSLPVSEWQDEQKFLFCALDERGHVAQLTLWETRDLRLILGALRPRNSKATFFTDDAHWFVEHVSYDSIMNLPRIFDSSFLTSSWKSVIHYLTLALEYLAQEGSSTNLAIRVRDIPRTDFPAIYKNDSVEKVQQRFVLGAQLLSAAQVFDV